MIEHFIGGRFVPSIDGATFVVEEPATEAQLEIVASASASDVDEAVKAARQAFDEGPWPRMRAAERADALLALADILTEHLEAIASLEARDTGMPLHLTRGGHLPRAIAQLRYFAGETDRNVGECYSMDGAYLQLVIREPVGVAAVLGPWNSPLPVMTMGFGAALACGNTCILKPSELAPLSTATIASAVAALDLPPGVVNVVHGPAETGGALVAHPGVDVVSFTGSTKSGRKVLETAAATVKRVTCELGGKSAVIVFADADFDRAIDGAVLGIFSSNGEACMAGSRILVERSLYGRFAERFAARAAAIRIGDPLDAGTEMGPLISHVHRERVLAAVDEACREGGRVLTGRRSIPKRDRGWFMTPTVVDGLDTSATLAREEIFGPVAVLIPFDGADQAIAIANDSPYGLASYVWTREIEKALAVSARLRTGSVAINSSAVRDLRVPFGGYKQSGVGRLGGRYSVHSFTELKTTTIPVEPYLLPRLGAGGQTLSQEFKPK